MLELEIRLRRVDEENERLRRRERKYKERVDKGKEALEALESLGANFEKSEQIRKKQKALIASLKEELARRA